MRFVPSLRCSDRAARVGRARRHLPVLVEALGMSAADQAWVLDAQFDPAQLRQQSVREEITSTLDAAFMQKDADEWVEIFEAADVWHHREVQNSCQWLSGETTGCHTGGYDSNHLQFTHWSNVLKYTLTNFSKDLALN